MTKAGVGTDDWIRGHVWDPTVFEPLGVDSDGWVICADPEARGDNGITYESNQFNEHPYSSGNAHVGIGCAWRDFGTTEVSVKLEWSGNFDLTSGNHVEAAPLLHVVPGTSEHAVGVWLSSVPLGPDENIPPNYASEIPALFFGTIGNPPEAFDLIYLDSFPGDGSHVDGTPRIIEVISDGTTITVFMDDVECFTGDTLTVPVALQGSTLHGAAVDTHFGYPWANIVNIPVFRNLEVTDLS